MAANRSSLNQHGAIPPPRQHQIPPLTPYHHPLFILWNCTYVFVGDYGELWQWSIDNLAGFWGTVWEDCGLIYSKPYERVVDETAQVDQIPEWFHGARLNYAENLLLSHGLLDHHAPALIFTNEADQDRFVTRGQLKDQVVRMARVLRDKDGIRPGDVVGLYCPNTPEATIFALAAASLGAIITAVSPDFGHQAVLDRFLQTGPKIILIANAVLWNGKVHDHWGKAEGLLGDCASIRRVVWFEYIKDHPMPDLCDTYATFESYTTIGDDEGPTFAFEQLPFNHPLFIMYSSGTTGKPKCLVHSAGGTLLQHLKEHKLHADLQPGDRLLQYTTVGWMMWQWQLSALALGVTLVLYDGSPFRPDEDHLLRVLGRLQVTAFGTGAKYLQRCEEAGLKLDDPSHLKLIFSTGSPLPSTTFDYITDAWKPLLIASITGGTDIISLFAGGNPALPLHSGLIQCRCLGMAVYAFDEAGKAVYDEPGDLVCTRPFPSQPVHFWGDPDGALYKKAYFSAPGWPHVWHHGDFIQIDSASGGVLMLGRSDGTLNPAGVRFGSADIYNVLGACFKASEIADSLVVGVRRDSDPDERVFLFLQLPDQLTLDDELQERIRQAIRSRLSPRHVPAVIMACPQIPYTLNGKKVEVAVKRILSGMQEVTAASLANPESLDFFRSLNL